MLLLLQYAVDSNLYIIGYHLTSVTRYTGMQLLPMLSANSMQIIYPEDPVHTD